MKTIEEFREKKITVGLQQYAKDFQVNLDHFAEETKDLIVYDGGFYINVQKDGSFKLYVDMAEHTFESLEVAEEYLYDLKINIDNSVSDHEAPLIAYLGKRNWNPENVVIKGVIKDCAKYIDELNTEDQ